MSISVLRSNATDGFIEMMVKYLSFTPKNQYYTSSDDYDGKTFSVYASEEIVGKKNLILPLYVGIFLSRSFNVPIVESSRYAPEMIKERFGRTNIKFTGKLFDYQSTYLVEALETLSKERGLCVSLHTGAGKSVFAVAITAQLGLITIVVIHLTFLNTQFEITYNKFTSGGKIIVVGDKGEVPEDGDVYICMYTRIDRIPDSVKARIGLVVVDEAHLFCTPVRSKALLKLDTAYIVMLTATPDLTNGLGDVILSFCGNNRLVKYFDRFFEVHCVETSIVPTMESDVRGQLKWSVYLKSLFYNDERNLYIIYQL